jgi:hypothetical protein
MQSGEVAAAVLLLPRCLLSPLLPPLLLQSVSQ